MSGEYYEIIYLKSTELELPNALANKLHRQNATIPAILRLHRLHDYSHPVYVSWNGVRQSAPAGKLGLPQAMASSLGLRPGEQVELHIEGTMPKGTSVEVEPVGPDDWEVLDLNAGELEESIARQAGIACVGQVLVVFTRSNAVIRLKVLRATPANLVRFADGCELLVAPKPRSSHLQSAKSKQAGKEEAEQQLLTSQSEASSMGGRAEAAARRMSDSGGSTGELGLWGMISRWWRAEEGDREVTGAGLQGTPSISAQNEKLAERRVKMDPRRELDTPRCPKMQQSHYESSVSLSSACAKTAENAEVEKCSVGKAGEQSGLGAGGSTIAGTCTRELMLRIVPLSADYLVEIPSIAKGRAEALAERASCNSTLSPGPLPSGINSDAAHYRSPSSVPPFTSNPTPLNRALAQGPLSLNTITTDRARDVEKYTGAVPPCSPPFNPMLVNGAMAQGPMSPSAGTVATAGAAAHSRGSPSSFATPSAAAAALNALEPTPTRALHHPEIHAPGSTFTTSMESSVASTTPKPIQSVLSSGITACDSSPCTIQTWLTLAISFAPDALARLGIRSGDRVKVSGPSPISPLTLVALEDRRLPKHHAALAPPLLYALGLVPHMYAKVQTCDVAEIDASVPQSLRPQVHPVIFSWDPLVTNKSSPTQQQQKQQQQQIGQLQSQASIDTLRTLGQASSSASTSGTAAKDGSVNRVKSVSSGQSSGSRTVGVGQGVGALVNIGASLGGGVRTSLAHWLATQMHYIDKKVKSDRLTDSNIMDDASRKKLNCFREEIKCVTGEIEAVGRIQESMGPSGGKRRSARQQENCRAQEIDDMNQTVGSMVDVLLVAMSAGAVVHVQLADAGEEHAETAESVAVAESVGQRLSVQRTMTNVGALVAESAAQPPAVRRTVTNGVTAGPVSTLGATMSSINVPSTPGLAYASEPTAQGTNRAARASGESGGSSRQMLLGSHEHVFYLLQPPHQRKSSRHRSSPQSEPRSNVPQTRTGRRTSTNNGNATLNPVMPCPNKLDPSACMNSGHISPPPIFEIENFTRCVDLIRIALSVSESNLKSPLEIKVPTPCAMVHSQCVNQPSAPIYHLDETPPSLDQRSIEWMRADLERAYRRLSPALDTEHIRKLVSSGLPKAGGLLVVGPSGSGKSLLLAALATLLAHPSARAAHTIHLRCSRLAGSRAEDARAILEVAITEAIQHAPALLLLDDLDALLHTGQGADVRAEDGGSGKKRLTSWLCEVMDWLLARDIAVAIAASTKDAAALPSPVRLAGRLDFQVRLRAPGSAGRLSVLTSALSSRGNVTWDDNALASIAAKAEGYKAADLQVLAERAVHAALTRQLSAAPGIPQSRAVSSRNLEVSVADLESAFDGYVPPSLWNVRRAPGAASMVKGWCDVGGLAEVRTALAEALLLPVRYPHLVAAAPLRLRTGVLLYGPPGCGKTHVVAAAAAEIPELRLISVKGPELLNKYIGASEAAVRDLFARASAAAPCLLFFDEFDAIAPPRGHDSTGVTDRVVNQLLTELDGVGGLKGVTVIAATSRPDLIDPALLRPGRLDRALYCGLPEEDERYEVLIAAARSMPLADDVDLQELAAATEGFTGADLAGVLSEAQLNAVHRYLDEKDGQKASGNESTRVPSTHEAIVQSGVGESTSTSSIENAGKSVSAISADGECNIREPDKRTDLGFNSSSSGSGDRSSNKFMAASSDSTIGPGLSSAHAASRSRAGMISEDISLAHRQAAAENVQDVNNVSQKNDVKDPSQVSQDMPQPHSKESTSNGDDQANLRSEGPISSQPVITRADVWAAFSNARPSLPASEIDRLDALYQRFSSGRAPGSGEDKGKGKRATLK